MIHGPYSVKTAMPPVTFEAAIPASELSQTHAVW